MRQTSNQYLTNLDKFEANSRSYGFQLIRNLINYFCWFRWVSVTFSVTGYVLLFFEQECVNLDTYANRNQIKVSNVLLSLHENPLAISSCTKRSSFENNWQNILTISVNRILGFSFIKIQWICHYSENSENEERKHLRMKYQKAKSGARDAVKWMKMSTFSLLLEKWKNHLFSTSNYSFTLEQF